LPFDTILWQEPVPELCQYNFAKVQKTAAARKYGNI
jgi:hypothetical protein